MYARLDSRYPGRTEGAEGAAARNVPELPGLLGESLGAMRPSLHPFKGAPTSPLGKSRFPTCHFWRISD